jgi:hypothetical protein
VLEHIPSPGLEAACSELTRVARRAVVVGVPFRQDTRIGRTTCRACRRPNPPWGHVNEFDRMRIERLFPRAHVAKVEYVGTNLWATNALAVALLDFAGNPYGTYDQHEPCIFCGSRIVPPGSRTIVQRAATRLGTWVAESQSRWLHRPHPNWIHVLLTPT